MKNLNRILLSVAIATLFALSFTSISAQTIVHKGPLNPEYIKYMELLQSRNADKYTPEGYKLNYIPNPFRINFKDYSRTGVLKSSASLPDRFDLRDSSYVTSAKDQGGGEFGGNCVAFATMGALESNWLKMNGISLDLSEQNQAACYGFEWAYGDGATTAMPAAYLLRFSGPVLESQDPYDLEVQTCNSSFDPYAYVPEVRWLPKDNELIKRKLMNFGAMPVSVHIEYSQYRESDNTYYYDGDLPGNHAFLLCGWDDSKETAGGTGAWIIKNSWGDDWGDNGYVYVSYNDTKVLEDITLYPYRWDTDEVDQIHMYDQLGPTVTIGLKTTATDYDFANGLVKFRASSEQLISRIGTYVLTEGAVLDIEIYRSFDGTHLRELITSLEDIYIEYPGFHTFSLPFTVTGDFYVKIRYYTPGKFDPLPVETFTDDEEGNPWADPTLETNVSWYGREDTVWTLMDTITEPANLCIRAYGMLTSNLSATIAADRSLSCTNGDIMYTAVTTGDITSWEWDFGEGASPATASTVGPHTVKYSSIGTKHVKLIVSDGSENDTSILYNAVEIVDNISLKMERDILSTPVRRAVELKAFGADTYSWSPAEYLDQTDKGIITATPTVADTFMYTVTGIQGDCEVSKQVKLISQPRPDNDDVCDALEIYPGGYIGKFTNENATVEDNEPAPETGDGGCTAPLMWCTEAEGKLQHTIWFTFTGPETNQISIDTKGFDNQIAVYKAESCEDVLNGNYFLAAANDDYYDADLANAAALEGFLALQGSRYFLQIDGSFGGQEGIMELTLMAYPLGYENISEQEDQVLVYPNPTNGQFTLQVNRKVSHDLSIEIYNTNGQMIFRESYYNSQQSFTETYDLSSYPVGIYHMKVITEGHVAYRKIVKN